MLEFSRIRFKNILSFGNNWTTIDFASKNSILIQGNNGTGKSAAILDSVCWVLFGKPFRKVSKSNLVNYKNRKEMVVEVWFKSDLGAEYHIVRGLNPQVFEIYKDDVLINQDSAIRDYQEYLEKQILKIDYQAFTQIVILGKATYVAFLRLGLSDRRKFIENVLNLNIFGGMNEVTKSRIAETKNLLQAIKIELSLLKQKIEMTKKHIEDFEQEAIRQKIEHDRFIDSQIQDIQNQITEIESSIEGKRGQIVEVEGDLTSLNKKLETCYDLQSKMSAKINEIRRRIKFFSDNEVCPTCENALDAIIKQSKISQFDQKEQELVVAQQQLTEKTESIGECVRSIQQKVENNRKLNQEIQILEHAIQQKLTMIANAERGRNLPTRVGDDKIQEKKDDLVRLEDERESKNEDRNRLNVQLDCLEFIVSMLKDTGIKSSIIKTHIPRIETIMNGYLRSLGLFVKFELNENFEETLLGRGINELTYNGYSEGEKLRIDLAMMMTWREVSRLQNNLAVNFLVFDEILDASLDENGAESLIDLFKELVRGGTKVIVISHSSEKWESGFNEIMVVERKGGFSTISQK